MGRKLFRILLLTVLSFTSCKTIAQLFVGFTTDLGNKVSSSPTSPTGLLKHPVMPSASLVILNQNPIGKEWLLQYGLSFGSLGYNLKALPYDTLKSNQFYAPQSFPSYGTFYVSTNLEVGRRFQFDRREVRLLLGGGLTLYRDWIDEGKFGKSPDVILFEYDMRRKDDKPKGFIEATIQSNISDRIVMGIRYRHHFNNALQGNYKFNQANSSGQLSLNQSAFSIIFLVRLTST